MDFILASPQRRSSDDMPNRLRSIAPHQGIPVWIIRRRRALISVLAMNLSQLKLSALVFTLAVIAPGSFAADDPAGSGDPVWGKAVYRVECTGCHAVNQTLIGPKHCGVFGRRAGTVPGYAYSDAMKQARFVWDAKHLDEFLKSPITYLNGTNMGYAGLDSARDRASVIAYLRQAMDPTICMAATNSSTPLPQAGQQAR